VNCPIYYNDGAGRARYSHDNGGTQTPYNRVLYLEDIGGGQVEARSVVTWNMHPSGEEQTLVLKTYIHDIYDFSP
jgi:hypothetical protein